ncbi:hypothetical protein [Gulosibacter faecalis]|uniref:DUF3137 domain-containing protein n=1 Tax=Gulosibacter faecalis TaxID=272240 RepID=A0ABW5UTQ2_9MICO|nr:hypothetical protein [Gulosibacter faecalis]
MTTEPQAPAAPRWPADPESAWREATHSPDPITRLTDPPEVESADFASTLDWLGEQRSMLPAFAVVAAVVGAIVLGGLAVGVLPMSGAGAIPAPALWAIGIGLLVVAVALTVWELVRRMRQRGRDLQEIPPVRIVLCELRTSKFHVHEGDGYHGTCVAIDAAAPDAQAARLLTAFRIWLARLEADPDADIAARDVGWQPRGATVMTAEEIFGPQATGGYLVRQPNPPADGWGLLITPRRPAKLVGQLRFAEVLRWRGEAWTL